MATLEDVRTKEAVVAREAQLHNAGIQERYRRLRDAEERQFSQETQAVNEYNVHASILAPEKPAFSIFEQVPQNAQTPQVTEYVRERIQSPVFTTEKFEAIASEQTLQAPTMVQAPVELPQTFAPQAVQAEQVQEVQYSLNGFAKKAIVAFCAVVTMMTALIGVNTHFINEKRMQIDRLETEQEQLVAQSEALQSRIREATSEESIREYAISQGMIQVNG